MSSRHPVVTWWISNQRRVRGGGERTTSWCLTTAVDYVKVREQFGRPVGSFQAVAHKAALLLVRAEVCCAGAWDAARAMRNPPNSSASPLPRLP